MLPALLGYPFLNTGRTAAACSGRARLPPPDEADPKTDELRLGDWLAAHGQDERTRRVLWDLFSVSSLNVPGDDASLALAAVVVKTGLLGDADAADIGVPALPLGELHGTAAARRARQARRDGPAADEGRGDRAPGRAGRRRVPHRAGALRRGRRRRGGGTARRRGRARGAARAGREAGPGGRAARGDRRRLGRPRRRPDRERARHLRPQGDGRARSRPPSTPRCSGCSTGRGSPACTRAATTGQYLAISLSAADEYANTPVAELREKFVPALAELFPAAKDATVTEFFVTREKRATFRQVPGTAKLRPKAATGTARPGAGGLVDRHRLAGHDGGRGPQRPERGDRAARGGTPRRRRDC